MKNKTIYLGSLLALIAVILVVKYGDFSSGTLSTIDQKNLSELEEKKSSLLPEFNLPFFDSPKDEAWDLFQKYLNFNQVRDLEGVKSVVYKISPVCEDPKQKIDCEARMGAAHLYGSSLKKQDFVNVWRDEKQIILSTNFWTEENEEMIGRFRSIIYFIRDEKGNLKLLSFSPSKGGGSSKGNASREELEARVKRYTEDNDLDGKADYTEECLDAKEGEVCTKTDPRLRDTDGDGLWDGIEALL